MISGITLQALFAGCLGACPAAVRVDLPRNGSGLPGATVAVRVNIDTAECLESMDLQLGYDIALLEVQNESVRLGTLTAGELMVPNVNPANGTITIGLAILQPKGPGGGSLIEIDFKIKSSLSPLELQRQTALDLRSVSLNEDGIALNPKPVPGPDAADGLISILPDATFKCEVTPTALAFGNVEVDQSKALPFSIKSTGTGTLKVESASLGAGTSAEFTLQQVSTPLSIPPGESRAVEVTYKPTAAGADSGSVQIKCIDPANPARPPDVLNLSGTGIKPEIEVSPLTLDFGTVDVDQSVQKPISIKNTGTAPLQITGVAKGAGTSQEFTLAPFALPQSVAAGQTVTLNVSYKPSGPGLDEGTVEIKSNDKETATVTVSLSGAGKEVGTKFRRGDLNVDGKVDITDPVRLLGFLFLGGAKPECLDAGDTDDSGMADISDAVSSLNYQFLGGRAPADPGPINCGLDPTPDVPAELGCDVGC